MQPTPCRAAVLLLCLLASARAHAQATLSHLTVYDAGVAEFLEERTVELQPGTNQVEWRSLMPRAFLRTLRVTAEGADVVRQDVTYDGPQVRDQRSPVLHLVLNRRGSARTARIRVDYMAPAMSWDNDYSLVLAPTAEGVAPTAASLDSWVSLTNETGTDVRAGTVDLIAGEIALLVGDGQGRRLEEYAVNVSQMAGAARGDGGSGAVGTGVGAFSRFRLGSDIALYSNTPMVRQPLFQGARLGIVQRNVFENAYGEQTLAGGGFTLLPRGLEVRLVSRNPNQAAMPAGQVTVYASQGDATQIVGQGRVPLTPAGGEFTVALGRSSTLFGTRRVLERRQEPYSTPKNETRYRLTTRVEVVLTNRGPRAAEAIVREGVEPNGLNQWRMVESSTREERLGANSFQMVVQVPAGGTTTVSYTIETT